VVSHIVGAERRSGQGGAFEAVQRSSHVGRPKLEGATVPTGEGVMNAECSDPNESSKCANSSIHRVFFGNLRNLYLLIMIFSLCCTPGPPAGQSAGVTASRSRAQLV